MKAERDGRNAERTYTPDGGIAHAHIASDHRVTVPRLRQITTVAHLEFRLAIRSRWPFALATMFVLFGAFVLTFSGSAVGPEGVARIIASFGSLAVYLVPLAALAFGYDAVVGRDEEGWLEVVFALPVTRARVVIGMFLGHAIVLAGAVVLGFGLVGLLLLFELGAASWGSYLLFLGSTVVLSVVFLALAVAVSTAVVQKTHALALSLAVWVWFVLVHDLLALALTAAFRLSGDALTIFILANPTNIFRVLILSELGTGGGSGIAGAFASTSLSVGMLGGALFAWCVGPLLLAIVLARRRRL